MLKSRIGLTTAASIVLCIAPLSTAFAQHIHRSVKSQSTVDFLIGGYMESEGSDWDFRTSPLDGPFGIDFDSNDTMFIVELESGRLLKRLASGELITLRDSHEKGYAGDGQSITKAKFNGPHNCVVTAEDDVLIADSWNHCVRRFDPKTNQVDTIAGTGVEGFSGDGGNARDATFNFVMCIAINPSRTLLHIADLKNRRIRNVDLKTSIATTVAGNGKNGKPTDGAAASSSPLVDPRAIDSDPFGNLYILERNSHCLRVVRPDGTIETVAGTGEKGFRDGSALEAEFGSPKHICCDPHGNVYIADDLNGAVRKFDPAASKVTTVLGRGFGDPDITLSHPHGVRWNDGALYVVDTGHNRILRITEEIR